MRRAATWICAGVLWATASANATIIGVSGAVSLIAPPASVAQGGTESDSIIFAFDEQQSFTLTSALFVNASVPGTYGPTTSPGAIPAGTTVSSHYIHYDPVGITTPVRTAQGV